MMDPTITEICQRVRITDYLAEKGVDLFQSGPRTRCKCPLGTHRDSDPSCYIRTMPDGAEVFHCFGCGVSGNIITLMHLMNNNEKKGIIIKRLADRVGLKLGKFNEATKTEPLPHEIMQFFCDEDEEVEEVSRLAFQFMTAHKRVDAINKVSRLYEMVDKMSDRGERDQLGVLRDKLWKIITDYAKNHEQHPPDSTP